MEGGMRSDLGNPEGLLLCRIDPPVDLWRDAAYAAQPLGMHTAAHPCRQEHALCRRVVGRSGGSFFGEHGISAERVGGFFARFEQPAGFEQGSRDNVF